MPKPKADKTIQLLNEAAAALAKAAEPLHYQEIAVAIGESGRFTQFGPKPPSEVYTAIYNDLNNLGSASRFRKSGPGRFALATAVEANPAPASNQTDQAPSPTEIETSHAAGFIQAFGMYWRRELVDWKNQPKLLGIQLRGATAVDFGPQKGVYLLHDGRAVIYVGRTTDQTMAQRLFQHTYDRLNGRWDRFSWFGILPIDENGNLTQAAVGDFTVDDLVAAMEALLIEAVEPPQNRRRGDLTGAVEYLQEEDGRIKTKREKEILAALAARIGV